MLLTLHGQTWDPVFHRTRDGERGDRMLWRRANNVREGSRRLGCFRSLDMNVETHDATERLS